MKEQTLNHHLLSLQYEIIITVYPNDYNLLVALGTYVLLVVIMGAVDSILQVRDNAWDHPSNSHIQWYGNPK